MYLDFSALPADEPLGTLEAQGMQGMLAAVRTLDPSGGLTMGEIGRRYGQSVLAPQVAGTAHDVADRLEAWFNERAADGS